ncbi:hypothetical protein KKH43_01410 [Patescibacteria group bacterium]|nr:hypothetical protein [Patescibacteria group bacterium]
MSTTMLECFLLSIVNIPSSIAKILEKSGLRIVSFNPDERKRLREEQLSKQTIGKNLVSHALENAGVIGHDSPDFPSEKFTLVSARGTQVINARKVSPGSWFEFLFSYLGNRKAFEWGIEEIHIGENAQDGSWDLNITISKNPDHCAKRGSENSYVTSEEDVAGEEKEFTRLDKISRVTLQLIMEILTKHIKCIDRVELYNNSECFPMPGKTQNPNVLRFVKPIPLNGKQPKLLTDVLGEYSDPERILSETE